MNVLVLGMLFISASMLVWLVVNTGINATERYVQRLYSLTETQLQKFFVFTDVRRVLGGYFGAFFIVVAVMLFLKLSPVVIAFCVLFLLMTPRWTIARLAARRSREINRQLPDALQQIAGAMQAGSTLISAMQIMVEERNGAIAQEFSLLLREQRLGTGLEEALDNLGERVQTEEMDLVISAVMISQDVGGNLSEVLQRLSVTIRRKLEMEGKVKALSAQGVLQGRVVTALPFAILVILLMIEPEAMEPIFTGVLGWVFLLVIVVLLLIGGLTIRKIVRIDI
ncbi:MAG: type II secretion system F family protein [Gammaproteobacteria bacterium]|nr:type II secretion system F family protein [Gammaproteobacteria bacterium]